MLPLVISEVVWTGPGVDDEDGGVVAPGEG